MFRLDKKETLKLCWVEVTVGLEWKNYLTFSFFIQREKMSWSEERISA